MSTAPDDAALREDLALVLAELRVLGAPARTCSLRRIAAIERAAFRCAVARVASAQDPGTARQ